MTPDPVTPQLEAPELVAPELVARARRWIADDPDPAARAELEQLLEAALRPGMHGKGACNELADRMAGQLRFGTAGLRGPVRAGTNGMNVAVVRRTTAGLAAWLIAHRCGGGTVVVGRDARHGSPAFAAATTGVLAADLAATPAAAGSSLLEALDELAVRYGVHATGALTAAMTPAECAAALDRVAGLGQVERPAPDVLVLRQPGQCVAVRPSGTEPKLKAYLEVVEPVPTPDALPAARERAAERLAMLSAEITALLGGPPSPPC